MADVKGLAEVRRVTAVLGAEIEGVDLRQILSGEQTATVKQALSDHGVLFFRDQHGLDDEAQLRFTQQLGPLEPTMKAPIFPIHTDAETPPGRNSFAT